jgi:hypothetical protein
MAELLAPKSQDISPLYDDRRFLIDLKQGNADWEKFPLPDAQMLPAIQWKLLNLGRMAPRKRLEATHKLENVLFG